MVATATWTDVAATLGNIGNVLDDLGKHEQALVHMQKGLEIKLKLLGSEHPVVATISKPRRSV